MPEEKLRQYAMARMTEQDFEWLRKLAEEKQVSVSAAIRVLIQDEARRRGWNGKEAKHESQ
uniref:Uncharacterized protein n=1 Tax=viral metagenome TaxID=1070528 RepID=A0A6M3KQQ1_9ZZZZ